MIPTTFYRIAPEADGMSGAQSRAVSVAMRAYGLRRLARALDVSPALPSLWLTGQAQIPAATWSRAAAILGFPDDPSEIDPDSTRPPVFDRSGPKSDARLAGR